MSESFKTKAKVLDPKEDEKKVHEEFSSRYNELTNTETIADGLPNPYAALPILPFDDPDQQVVLLNITHRQQIPRSKIPGFRVCGAFKDIDKLKRHALSCGGPAGYGGSNLIKADVHKKFLICSSLEKQQNPSYVLDKIERLSQSYVKTLQYHTEEFQENKEKRQQGKVGLSGQGLHDKTKKISSRKQLLDKKFEEDKEKGTESGEVSRNAEVRNQTVAVVTIMEDSSDGALNHSEDPEPIVIVWGCFENEAQAKHYIYNTASKYVKDVMLDIVNMYEWVFPTELTKRVDELTEEFRNPSLNKVMNSRKTQKRSVMSYDEWCRREGQEPASLEINATKETAESTEVKTVIKKTEDFKITVSTKDNETTDQLTLPNLEVKKSSEDQKETPPPDGSGDSGRRPDGSGDAKHLLPQALFESHDWKPIVESQVNALYKDVTFKTDTPAEPSEEKKRRGRPKKTK